MKIQVWKALARGVWLESIRRKDLYVVGILGFLIVVSASALGFFGLNGLEAFAKDLSATVLGLFSTIIAVLTASRMLPEEIKNRTLYPLLSRPITRFDLLMGKLIGSVIVTWTGFLILTTLTGLALMMFHVHFEATMLQYIVAKMMGLVVICSISVMLSTYMTPAAAATMSFVLAFGSAMILRGLTMAYDGAAPAVQGIFKFVTMALPQVHLFDFGSRVANSNWGLVPSWVMGFLFAYMVIYSGAMLSLSWWKFRKQAV
ncbi:MAG: ABC transporter permease subunit [Fimbriimonadaceae bacterium]|nr:ABC transporter permease subunit [Fimbriimonadaceae bacterium]